MEDIRAHILRVSGVYLSYTTVTHALGAIKCAITELGVYASIYTPSYRPIRLICDDVMWYNNNYCSDSDKNLPLDLADNRGPHLSACKTHTNK